MTVITRFAPSPTGYLHIGGARTALFNYLFAKHHGGKFLLRIEDTDRERSTQEAVDAILDSMKWLQLDWDGDVIHQFSRMERHAEVARKLLAEGKAYYCYCSPQELEEMREEARARGVSPRYDGRWRDRPAHEAPEGVAPVIRFKAPQEGETVIHDLVQGDVHLQNNQMDDRVLLRADGTPTYMLSVVVDDHDMNITHIIRGDDHLTNSFVQYHLYKANEWKIPEFAHIPLIHGADGAKLSKRHGALGAEAYRDLGFLPEAICNYLLRLGWGHGDDEIISREQAIEWFSLEGVGRSAARFDTTKLTNLNGHYMREASDDRLVGLIQPLLEQTLSRPLLDMEHDRLLAGMSGLKQRAKTIIELVQNSEFYIEPKEYDDKALKLVTPESQKLAHKILLKLKNVEIFTEASLEEEMRAIAEVLGEKLGNLAQPLRIALTGSTVSPSIFQIMAILGKEESLRRINMFLESR